MILFPLYLKNFQGLNNPYIQAARVRIQSGRIYSLFPLPTLYAMICGLLILLILHFFLSSHPRQRIFWSVLLLLGLINLFFTSSFGGILNLSAALLFYLIQSRKIHKKFLVPFFMACSLLFLIIVGTRFSEARSLEPLKLRFENWSQAGQLIFHKPLLGAGLGNYGISISPYVRQGETPSGYAHNFPLQIAAELGLPLIILLVLLLILWLKPRIPSFFSSRNIPFTSALVLIGLYNLTDIGLYFFSCGICAAFFFSQILPYRKKLHPIPTVIFSICMLLWLYGQYAAAQQRQADYLASINQTREAHDLYEKTLRLTPYSYQSLLGLANLEFREKNNEKTKALAECALRYSPNSGFAHYLLSQILYNKQMYIRMVYHARMAAVKNPRNSLYRQWYELVQTNFKAQMAVPGN